MRSSDACVRTLGVLCVCVQGGRQGGRGRAAAADGFGRSQRRCCGRPFSPERSSCCCSARAAELHAGKGMACTLHACSKQQRLNPACLQAPAAGASGRGAPARPQFNAPKATGGVGASGPAAQRPTGLAPGGAAKPIAAAPPAPAAAAAPIAVYAPEPEPVAFGKPVPLSAATIAMAASRQVRAPAAAQAQCFVQ